jgi:hypothetical protein
MGFVPALASAIGNIGAWMQTTAGVNGMASAASAAGVAGGIGDYVNKNTTYQDALHNMPDPTAYTNNAAGEAKYNADSGYANYGLGGTGIGGTQDNNPQNDVLAQILSGYDTFQGLR